MGRRGLYRGPYEVDGEDLGLPPTLSVRQRLGAARLERLEGDARVRAAAMVAHTFRLDPVEVLDERDDLKVLARVAAHNIVQREARRAASGK